MVSNLLGVSVEEAEEEVNISKGLTVRKCWLKSRWCPKAGSRPRTYPPMECTARAYLLYLLSCTLFADKSGSRVSIALLKLLEDLDDVGKYAWGAVALAYLYRHLGSATRAQMSQIACYLTLLEVCYKIDLISFYIIITPTCICRLTNIVCICRDGCTTISNLVSPHPMRSTWTTCTLVSADGFKSTRRWRMLTSSGPLGEP
ncbi:hypothetical protein Syun_018999 [Stephania yunnanensis]|uniref:Aminotransferase-like plant mobile domain-containing protein n=1 Tax=Stephania yunnanensis TaxID=152371 RepID=A0AAP0IV87_9MAGN